MAERDPDTIKQEIDQARDQLASTVDSLAERANPRRLADDAKARVIGFVKKPAVAISLAGIAALRRLRTFSYFLFNRKRQEDLAREGREIIEEVRLLEKRFESPKWIAGTEMTGERRAVMPPVPRRGN